MTYKSEEFIYFVLQYLANRFYILDFQISVTI